MYQVEDSVHKPGLPLSDIQDMDMRWTFLRHFVYIAPQTWKASTLQLCQMLHAMNRPSFIKEYSLFVWFCSLIVQDKKSSVLFDQTIYNFTKQLHSFLSKYLQLWNNRPTCLNGHLSIKDCILTSCQEYSSLHINSPITE